MFGMLQGIHLFLLQVDPGPRNWYKKDNPMDAITVLIVLGVIIAIAVLVSAISKTMNPSGKSRSSGSGGSPKKFNSFTLYRVASAYGLDRDQTKLLEGVFRSSSVTDIDRVMKNSALLDRSFKRTYKSIERNSANEEDAQQQLVKLFSLRNLIDAAPENGSAAGHISANSAAVLVAEKESYPVKVISSQGQNVVTEIPRNALGTPVHLTRGMRVSLSFFTRSSKGFSYEGQVAGLRETENGQGLHIVHTGKAVALVKRKYRRRQTSIRCAFFLVMVDDSQGGRKKATRLVVDTKRFAGSVQDLSIGGCSIRTTAPVQVGSRLKISIDYDDNSLITVLGQVLRTNRSGPGGTIIHIKFLKVPRRAFNSINALVFGYDEE